MDLLHLVRAQPVYQRIVRDRNRITGGGVTAGMDFALVLLAELQGAACAQTVKLGLEYQPEPPFSAGNRMLHLPHLLSGTAQLAPLATTCASDCLEPRLNAAYQLIKPVGGYGHT